MEQLIFVEYPDSSVDEFQGEVVYERDFILIYESDGHHRINPAVIVLKSSLDASRREGRRLNSRVTQLNKELDFRAEAYGRLQRRHLELENDHQALEAELRQLKATLPARDGRGRFAKH
jgi:hypothetical protein